jgi:Tol biopolymer transport system component
MSDLDKPTNGSPKLANELENALASFSDDLLYGNIELTEAENSLSESEALRELQEMVLRIERAFGPEKEPSSAMSSRIRMNLVTELRKMNFGEEEKPVPIWIRIQDWLNSLGKGRLNYLMPVAAIAAVFLVVLVVVFSDVDFNDVLQGSVIDTPERLEEVTPLVGINERVSVDSGGSEVDNDSWYSAISADGRYIAFVSASDELVVDDGNGMRDIFVHDRNTGDTERVSLGEDGQEGDGDSINPVISADGRFVAFESQAENFVTGDGNGTRDIFVRDRVLGTTELVSMVNGQAGDGDSRHPAISDDGRFVTFYSTSSDLTPNDGNGVGDVFLYDQQNGTMTAVSMTAQGQTGDLESRNPVVSGDGQFVAFESLATDLAANDGNNASDIFLYSRQNGSLTRISINNDGEEGDSHSYKPDLSADGSAVVFQSLAENLWESDSNDKSDVFIYYHDQNNQSLIERASVADGGGQSNGDSGSASVSADGSYVVFSSFANNLAGGEIYGTNQDIYLYDRQAGAVERISADLLSQEPDGASVNPDISADGRFVSFDSIASNLVENDSNSHVDVFVRDRMPPLSVVINYAVGTPGSFFTVTGSRFLPDSMISLVINGFSLGTVTSDPVGDFTIILATDDADPGGYILNASDGTAEGVVGFALDPNSSPRSQETEGTVFIVPSGIAYTHFNSLPLIIDN